MKKEDTEEKKYSKRILFSLLLIIVLVFSVISISFTAYVKIEKNKSSNEENQGNVSMTYTEDNNGISIENASPISDEVGKVLNAKGEYFDFTVTTKVAQDTSVFYEIAAIKDPNSTIDDKDVKIYLEKQKSGTYEQVMAPTPFITIPNGSNTGAPKGSMILQKVKKTSNSTDNYRLRMWVNETADIQDVKTYTISINVYGKVL